MKDKLASVIECFSTPALLVSYDDSKILASNLMFARSYGANFKNNFEVELEGIDKESSEPQFLQLVPREPHAIFRLSEVENATFTLLPFSSNAVLIYEMALEESIETEDLDSEDSGDDGSRDNAVFHFSYIQNLATGAWTYANPDLLSYLNLAPRSVDMSNFDWRDVIVKDDLPLYDNTVANVRQHGGNHEMHYRIKTLKGDIISICDYCSLASPDDRWPVLVGSIVSSEKKAANIRDSERQILTGRLVGGMIHDFKNLLGGIQNFIEWTISLSEKEEVVDALRKTLSYTEQATKLIVGALKVSSGQKDDKIEKVFIGKIIASFEDLIRRILPASINLEVEVEDDLPAVYGQQGLFGDMLINLCVNARDAMKTEGSELKIRAFRKEIKDEHGGAQDFVGICVRDNGCGMSEDDVKTIFNAFYSTKETGAGLGLWMVKEAVRSFDGKIDVKSKIGEGTVFEILFPVAEITESDMSSEEPVLEKKEDLDYVSPELFSLSGSMTVLYIEDDPLIRGSVSHWLEKLGFELVVAEDGEQGLNLFMEHRDDLNLIIQDLILPGIRGEALLEEFVKIKPEIPIIISSANPDKDEMAELKDKGAKAILSKPFKIQELIEILKSLM
jgi:signal transduction histidine kinase/CheY-like chemotaxis protein